jgi:FlaA1/EpsC-like NDP-sugar epimerase
MLEKVNGVLATAFSIVRKRAVSLPPAAKRMVALLFDMVAALVTVRLAIYFSSDLWSGPIECAWCLYVLAPGLMLPVFAWAGIYRAVSRYSGHRIFVRVVTAGLLYGIAFLLLVTILRIPSLPRSFAIMQPMMLLMMTGGIRAFLRFWADRPNMPAESPGLSNRLIIYGAGQAGMEIASALQLHRRFEVAGYFDDDRLLHGRTIDGLPVFDPSQAESLIRELGIRTVLVAMPSASRFRRNEIVRLFRRYPVSIKTLPGIDEIADGRVRISDIKEVEIEDLLGRDPVLVDQVLVLKAISGKVVVVTGAGGSIGSELCRQILFAGPSKLLLIDNSEYNLYKVHDDLENRQSRIRSETLIVPLLCDVSEGRRFNEICRVFSPAVIYHAAAYKHVPMVEHNLAEGVRINVFGTLNVVEAALEHEVTNVVLISTDKAVRPTNVMGASKRLCEMILQAYAAEGNHSTCFSMVRFGNVLGSSGSVVPLFRRQIQEGGPITITHKEITRYFMTIPEAAQLVIHAGAMAVGGEVYLLEMGNPVKIMDLARRMVELSGLSVRDYDNPEGDIDICITGLRPGEKLYEELLIGDNPIPTKNPRIFKAREHFIPLPEILSGLDLILESIKCNNILNIRQQLRTMVREYQPAKTETDLLYMEDSSAKDTCYSVQADDKASLLADMINYEKFDEQRKVKLNSDAIALNGISIASNP